jgi:transcriptional regulator, gntR family
MIMQDDRNGSIKPIYQQIREDLLLGFQKTGEARLPSEREICKKYGVCRPTVHKALSYLVETGLVVRRPGKGSFFLPPEAGSGRNVAGVKLVIRKDWKIWSGDCYFGQTIQGIYETLNGCGLNLSIEQFNDRLLLQLLEDEVTSSI